MVRAVAIVGFRTKTPEDPRFQSPDCPSDGTFLGLRLLGIEPVRASLAEEPAILRVTYRRSPCMLPSDSTAASVAGSQRFCQIFLAVSVLLFVGIAGMNFVVNPYAQYLPAWFTPMVQTSRAQKVQLVESCQPAPEGLILGSSRVLKLEPDYLERQTGYRFFNAGMNHGKTEDFLAFLRYYEDACGRPPKMVVLGLDVNAFTDGSPPDSRLLSNKELASRVPEAIRWSDRMQRWRELLSWQQTKNSLKSIKLQLTSGAIPSPVESFRADGLIVYHQRERELSEGVYDFSAALEYNKNEYKHLFRAFKKMSPSRCRVFEVMADKCQAEGVKLMVFLPPMHPELNAHLLSCTEFAARKLQVKEYVQQQADRFGFTCCDLSDVSSFAGDPQLFVDGVHPLEPNTRRMIDRLLTPQTGIVGLAVQ